MPPHLTPDIRVNLPPGGCLELGMIACGITAAGETVAGEVVAIDATDIYLRDLGREPVPVDWMAVVAAVRVDPAGVAEYRDACRQAGGTPSWTRLLIGLGLASQAGLRPDEDGSWAPNARAIEAALKVERGTV